MQGPWMFLIKLMPQGELRAVLVTIMWKGGDDR